MGYTDISREIAKYVESVFEKRSDPKLLYHNIVHTRECVEHAREIAAFYEQPDEMAFIITSSACFHDTGYLFGGSKDTE